MTRTLTFYPIDNVHQTFNKHLSSHIKTNSKKKYFFFSNETTDVYKTQFKMENAVVVEET